MISKNLARTSSTPGCTRQINFFACAPPTGMNLAWSLPATAMRSAPRTSAKLWADLIDGYRSSDRRCARSARSWTCAAA